eukprot:Awhi_evm1s1819
MEAVVAESNKKEITKVTNEKLLKMKEILKGELCLLKVIFQANIQMMEDKENYDLEQDHSLPARQAIERMCADFCQSISKTEPSFSL